jgi:hypothetical protein
MAELQAHTKEVCDLVVESFDIAGALGTRMTKVDIH